MNNIKMGSLILTRKLGEKIIIDSNIEVEIDTIDGNQVRIRVTAPEEIEIYREEIFNKKDFKLRNDFKNRR